MQVGLPFAREMSSVVASVKAQASVAYTWHALVQLHVVPVQPVSLSQHAG